MGVGAESKRPTDVIDLQELAYAVPEKTQGVSRNCPLLPHEPGRLAGSPAHREHGALGHRHQAFARRAAAGIELEHGGSDGTRRTPDERRDLNLVPSYSFVGDGKRPRGLDSTREGGGDDANAAPYRGCLGCRIVADQGAGTRFSLVFDKTFLPELPG